MPHLLFQRQKAERGDHYRRLERRYSRYYTPLHLNYRSCFVLERVGARVKVTPQRPSHRELVDLYDYVPVGAWVFVMW